MKKQLIISWLFFMIPAMSWGYNDACSKPAEYTVDKRCYVTDKQKQQKPYSAVVGIKAPGRGTVCTGTIIKKADNKLYLYTAKHCVDDKSGVPLNTIAIETQKGKSITVTKNKVGNYDGPTNSHHSGDWAVYDVPGMYSDIISTGISDKNSPSMNARMIGYGALKIMSDSEIEVFKQKYIKYLKEIKGVKLIGTGIVYDFMLGGVDVKGGPYGSGFVNYLAKNEGSYYRDMFTDFTKLKESNCKYSALGQDIGCQGWGGNSGGGIFDDDGNLIAIKTISRYIIGGGKHGTGSGNVRMQKDEK